MDVKYVEIRPKTVLNRLKGEDEIFHSRYTLNPYKGCEHGCQYCYARSEKYLPHSREEDFSQVIYVKVNAPLLLKKELPKLKKAIIDLGSACDPYQQAEKKFGLTRKILEVIVKHNFPLNLLTKSDLVLRDIDLFKKLDYCCVSFTVTTLDEKLTGLLEPVAPSPERRLNAMKKLNEEGITTGVLFMPIIPFLEDSSKNLESVISESKAHGARYVIASLGMTLRDNQKLRFMNFLRENYPELIPKYNELFGGRVSPGHAYMEKISKEINELCDKYKISEFMPSYAPKEPQTKLYNP